MTSTTIEIGCGETITDAIAEAIEHAKSVRDRVFFDFNGVQVRVAPDSDPGLIYRDWDRALKGYLGENPIVGPHPKRELSAEELASDAEKQREREARMREQQAKWDAERATKAKILEGALMNAGPLEVRDQEKWDQCKANNTDAYGGRVVRYAEEWGRLMQVRLANGETIAECADELATLADDDGITGFMYSAARVMLVAVWAHGAELRAWADGGAA